MFQFKQWWQKLVGGWMLRLVPPVAISKFFGQGWVKGRCPRHKAIASAVDKVEERLKIAVSYDTLCIYHKGSEPQCRKLIGTPLLHIHAKSFQVTRIFSAETISSSQMVIVTHVKFKIYMLNSHFQSRKMYLLWLRELLRKFPVVRS